MRYDISARLKAQYSKKNIKYILEQGIKKGVDTMPLVSDTEFKSLDLAVEGIMQPNEFGGRCIMAKRNGIVLDICIVDESGLIGMCIGNFESEELLEKVQFFLSMIKDFAIIHIDTMLD